ncbi:hypothetical protein LTR35_009005 [Friedmanniomyces endolithicus]|nr:hypothetical protein LTR35_009005 [Friedmanniomyces endolithicus]
MARPRGTPLDLTESWDDVHDDDDDDETLYTKDDERVEMRDSYRSDARDSAPSRNMRSSRTNFQSRADDGDRRRSARLSVEPELRMPSSPDAGRSSARAENLRASTPHFRLNNRSMTSDAGSMNGEAKMRASTPRMRLSQRSMTSDAGRFGSKVKDEDDDDEDASQPNVLWRRVLRPLLAYAFDVAGMAVQNLKPLLGYALLVYILVGALVFGAGFATNTITNALTPICRIPGASYLHLPFCPSPTTTELQGPAEFDKLVQAQSQFEDVLASTQVGANLPMDMKRSEASIRDLKHVVQYSTLPSRNELVFEFTGFIDTARQASQDLSKFNSRIGRAVDQILSTNRWTLSVIDGVSATEASRGALSRWATSNLNIFAPFQPLPLSRDALLNILDNLDGRLDIIASIATRDGIKIDDNKEELFAYLWTKLGGNRNTVAKLAQQSELLKEVGAYRRLAWAHVTTTIVRLQAIRDTLEDLRERVALPEVVGEKVPLEVHIESIRLGIERLEQQREAGRRVEAEGYARVMGRAGGGERREIGGKEGS